MAVNFPTSPTLNQTYVFDGITYIWDGTRWRHRGADYALLKNVENQQISGGAQVTAKQLTAGDVTIDCGARPLQYISNVGPFTITAPSNDGFCMLLIENLSGCGSVTFANFQTGGYIGDVITTIPTDKFTVSIWCVDGVASYNVSAHQ